MSDFTGGVFSERIDGGRAGATITLAPEGIVAFASDGQRFTVRWGDCQLEMGGASGRMVFCRNADRSLTIFCEDKRFPQALAQARGSGLNEQVEQMLVLRQARGRQGRGLLTLGLVALGLLLVGGYYGVMAGARAALKALPPSVDRTLGDHAFTAMEKEGPELRDPVVVDAIETIVERLGKHANAGRQGDAAFDFRVHVIQADVLNAFALPGGQIVVFTGLIAACDDPNELAGVIAHEMAHVTLRHGIERIGQSMGLALAVNLVLGNVEGIATAGVELLRFATQNKYSREQEASADAEGVRMMHAAGLDPRGLSRFFARLKAEGQGRVPKALEWISTHPDHDARIAAVDQQVDGLAAKPLEPLELEWAEVRRRSRGAR